eukprot:4156979-Amphidinium_carterae.1
MHVYNMLKNVKKQQKWNNFEVTFKYKEHQRKPQLETELTYEETLCEDAQENAQQETIKRSELNDALMEAQSEKDYGRGERTKYRLELCDLETQVERYMGREEEVFRELKDEVTERTKERDDIFDEWVADKAQMGWDEQSAQESHAQQSTTSERLKNLMSSIDQPQPQQTPTHEDVYSQDWTQQNSATGTA